MSLRHVVIAGTTLCALGIASPTYAPQLLASLLAPSASQPDAAGGRSSSAQERSPLPPAPVGTAVALRADASGQFEATAMIDDQRVAVVVDTGATAVALSMDTARRLGILPPQSAFRLAVSTANGTATAAPVTLDEVSVGGVMVRHVAAIVVGGDGLSTDLLGMTFLSRLSEFSVSRGELTLRQ